MDCSHTDGCLHVSPDGLARLDRRVYRSTAIFDAEIRNIWEKTWVFVAHESQVARPNDYVTSAIGRHSIILIRDSDGVLRAHINVCSHRGAKLLPMVRGHARVITCPYHAWAFNPAGELISVNGEAAGGYPESFDKTALGLTAVRTASYRGFVFVTLNPQAPSLEEHLGDAATFIDLLVDQSESGWEVLKGHSTYSYEGNWKLQAENGVDGYHAPFVHANFVSTIENRKRSKSVGTKTKAMNVRHDPSKMHGGYFDLGRGHVMIWRDWDNPEDRFNFDQLPRLEERLGPVRAKWALGRLRNLLIFPNLMIMDQMSTQLRVIKPIDAGRTEVTGYAFAPVGEAPERRRQRLRYFEDFFNPSGMATPDDLEIFNRSQEGFGAHQAQWSDMSRGGATQVSGANSFAEELGIHPVSSGAWIQDEGLFVGMYRAWQSMMGSVEP